ncbi:MAG: hypothetical protein IJW28_05205, partial [Clostridia bacterium]|nr:hypothetical protein [Clostridia bacterium]
LSNVAVLTYGVDKNSVVQLDKPINGNAILVNTNNGMIYNVYVTGNMYLSTNNLTEKNVSIFVALTINSNITNANYLLEHVYYNENVLYEGSLNNLGQGQGLDLFTIKNLITYFNSGTWDYVRVWSVYSEENGGLPVFKYFYDYIINFNIEVDKYTIVSQEMLLNNKTLYSDYWNYIDTLSTTDKQNVLVYGNLQKDSYYIVDIDNTDVLYIESNGSTTITVLEFVLNNDATIYVYKGASVNIRIIPIKYYHVNSVGLIHLSNTDGNNGTHIDAYDQRVPEGSTSIASEDTIIAFNIAPNIDNIIDIYDRDRFDYYVEIDVTLDEYTVSVSEILNQATASLDMVTNIEINDGTNSSTTGSLDNIKHGSTVTIDITLNSQYVYDPDTNPDTKTNIVLDKWIHKADFYNKLEEDLLLTDEASYQIYSREGEDVIVTLNSLYNT